MFFIYLLGKSANGKGEWLCGRRAKEIKFNLNIGKMGKRYDYLKVAISIIIGVVILVALWLVSNFGGV